MPSTQPHKKTYSHSCIGLLIGFSRRLSTNQLTSSLHLWRLLRCNSLTRSMEQDALTLLCPCKQGMSMQLLAAGGNLQCMLACLVKLQAAARARLPRRSSLGGGLLSRPIGVWGCSHSGQQDRLDLPQVTFIVPVHIHFQSRHKLKGTCEGSASTWAYSIVMYCCYIAARF